VTTAPAAEHHAVFECDTLNSQRSQGRGFELTEAPFVWIGDIFQQFRLDDRQCLGRHRPCWIGFGMRYEEFVVDQALIKTGANQLRIIIPVGLVDLSIQVSLISEEEAAGISK
jgi:hypothetical protein